VSINVVKNHDPECKQVGNTTVCPTPPYLEEHGNVTVTEKILGESLITTKYSEV
jgi:hypothetical protein